MAEFAQVQSIQTFLGDDSKGILQLKIAGAAEPLTVTCSCLDIAEDMADLIDGYCRLVHDMQKSLWTRKGKYACRISNSLIMIAFASVMYVLLISMCAEPIIGCDCVLCTLEY